MMKIFGKLKKAQIHKEIQQTKSHYHCKKKIQKDSCMTETSIQKQLAR